MVTRTAAQIYRDFVIDGVPASGPNKPSKSEIRLWGTEIESTLSNTRLAKTAPYTVANSDKTKTLALGGGTYFTLTFNAASGYDANFAVMVVNEDSSRGKIIAIDGYPNFILWPLQVITVFNQNNNWRFNRPGRWKLLANQTFYVNHASGADTNDGLHSLAAFATIQKAILTIFNEVDPSGFVPKIVCAAETFTENNVIVHGRLNGSNNTGDGQDIEIEGDPTTPTNCVWQVSSGTALFSISGSVKINGFKLVATASGCNGFFAEKGGFIHYYNMEFGAFASGSHIVMTEGGHVYWDGGTYKISGNMSTHVLIVGFCDWVCVNATINLPSALTFTTFLDITGPGTAQYASTSFTGAGAGSGSTGKKFDLKGSFTVMQGGVTLPGATAGTTDTGQLR